MKVDESILGALRGAVDGYVSGRLLAENLGVSRTTVWKRISRLRDRGYDIESSPRLGYRLTSPPDLLLPTEINEGLETSIIGREIKYFESTGSTAEVGRRAASEGCAEGTIVLAEEQTAGRGRLGRSWVSPPGGIWLSVVLRPLIAPVDTPKLTFLMAVSAA
ncbi:MAG: biotin operon repressor, partial [Terriglobia bacterium]